MRALSFKEGSFSSGGVYSRPIWRYAEGRAASAIPYYLDEKSFSNIEVLFCILEVQLRTKSTSYSCGA